MYYFSKLRGGLRTLDLFGQPIQFNIDGKVKYRSSFGGIVTIFAIIAVTFMFKSQIVSFFRRDKLTCHITQEYTITPTQINMTHLNYFFALRVEQPIEYLYNERPFYLVTINQHYNNDDNYTSIMLQPCTLERVLKFNQSTKETMKRFYEQYQLNSFLCPPDEFGLQLQGNQFETNYNYVSIMVSECINNTVQENWNYSCAPQEILDSYYRVHGAYKFTLYTSNYVVNPQTQESFYQLFLSQDLQYDIQPGRTQTKVSVPHQTYQISTDLSLFINEDTSQVNLIIRDPVGVSKQTIQSDTKQTASTPLIIYFTSGYYSYNAFRQFQKIDELLSYFGGIFNLFVIVFGIIMRVYNQAYFQLHLANKLYDFKSIPKNLQEKIQEIDHLQSPQSTNLFLDPYEIKRKRKAELSRLRLRDVVDQNRLSNCGFEDKIDFLVWYFHKALGKSRRLTFSFSWVLHILCCKRIQKTPENRLIQKAIEQIEEDMNIKHLVNQMIQVEKLKSLVMTKPQLQLFNYFHKPKIMPHYNQKKQQLLRSFDAKAKHEMKTKIDSQKFRLLVDAFKIVQAEPSLENKKLMYFLGTDLRRVIKACILLEGLDEVHLMGRHLKTDHIEEELQQDAFEIDEIKRYYHQIDSQPNSMKKDRVPSQIIHFEDL